MKIYKALQKDPIYKGLKARYINMAIRLLFICLISLALFSSIFPIVPVIILNLIIFISGIIWLLIHSKTYGADGFNKKIADKKLPNSIVTDKPIKSLLIWKKI